MLVEAQVSSMKISRSGSRSSWPSNQAARRLRISGRSCATACSSFFSTAAKLAVWQTGAIRFAVELEGRDGQTPVKDAGSGTRLTPAAPPLPGVRGRDAHPLREPPHPGDAVRHGACAPEGEALRGQGLCALP